MEYVVYWITEESSLLQVAKSSSLFFFKKKIHHLNFPKSGVFKSICYSRWRIQLIFECARNPFHFFIENKDHQKRMIGIVIHNI